MKEVKKSFRWQVVIALWLMTVFPVSFTHGQEKVTNQTTAQKVMQVVTGHVCDEHGEPIIGASVSCKEVGVGVITNMDGDFTIKINTSRKQVTLVISYLGMKKQEQIINFAKTKQPVKVVMVEEVTSIDQVVVTGIYNRSKDSFTGSYSSYDAKQLKNAVERGLIVVNISQCLAGAVEMERYETGIHLREAGVISGHDSTVESALTKLMFLLGHGMSPHEVRYRMNTPICGEITV